MKCNVDVLSHTVDMVLARDAGKVCNVPNRKRFPSTFAERYCAEFCNCSTSAPDVLRPEMVVSSSGSREDEYHPADEIGALTGATS